jgi:hypothetical protein
MGHKSNLTPIFIVKPAQGEDGFRLSCIGKKAGARSVVSRSETTEPE